MKTKGAPSSFTIILLVIAIATFTFTNAIAESTSSYQVQTCHDTLAQGGAAKTALTEILKRAGLATCDALNDVHGISDKRRATRKGIYRYSDGHLIAVYLDLSDTKISDLTPLQMFVIHGTLDLSRNKLHDAQLASLSEVTNNAHARLNLSYNNITSAEMLAKFAERYESVTADYNSIANPEKLPWRMPDLERPLYSMERPEVEHPFSIVGNTSGKGVSFDRVLTALTEYYQHLSKSSEYFNPSLEKTKPLFSEIIERFDTLNRPDFDGVMKHLTERAEREVNPAYFLLPATLKVTEFDERNSGTRVLAKFKVIHTYIAKNPAEVSPEFAKDRQIHKFFVEGQELSEVEMKFDSSYRIVSVKESRVPFQLKTLTSSRPYRLSELESCLATDDDLIDMRCQGKKKKRGPSFALPAGTVLDDSGIVLHKSIDSGRGQYDSHVSFRRVQMKGQPVWLMTGLKEYSKPGSLCLCADNMDDPFCRENTTKADAEESCAIARDIDERYVKILAPIPVKKTEPE